MKCFGWRSSGARRRHRCCLWSGRGSRRSLPRHNRQIIQPRRQSVEMLNDAGHHVRSEFAVVDVEDGGIARGHQRVDSLQQPRARSGIQASEHVQVHRPSAGHLVGSKRLGLGLLYEPFQFVLAIEAHSVAASVIIFAHAMRSRQAESPRRIRLCAKTDRSPARTTPAWAEET
jgi:hypothetical protein